MSNFKQLNLNTKILNALDKKGYVHPTAIQVKSIPHLLQGKDLFGIAQTGTGKTAAFALPILDNLSKNKKPVHINNIRALILTPTRELATQIADNIELYGHGLGLRYTVIIGASSIENQIKKMKQGFDIVVATPGRLLDLINRGSVKFDDLEILVLDEADRMLDMGFIHDVKKIIAKMPKDRQTLLFSATMPKDIAVLADSILNNPIKVEVTPQATTVEKIDQSVNFVEKINKPLLLKEILQQEDAQSVLVFSKTKYGADRIVRYLSDEGIRVTAIHGNKRQNARERALSEFRRGKVKVLIATDIAARGIDIPAISHVINYDIPHDPENYVHRIGRTARAGREGVAISFCDASERKFLKSVEKVINFKIPVNNSHSFHDVGASAEPKNSANRTRRFSADRNFNRGDSENKRSSYDKKNSYNDSYGRKKDFENSAYDNGNSRSSFGKRDKKFAFENDLRRNSDSDNAGYGRKKRARIEFSEGRNKRFFEGKYAAQSGDSFGNNSFEGKNFGFNSGKKSTKKFGSSKPAFAGGKNRNSKFATRKNNNSGSKNPPRGGNFYNKKKS